MRFLFCELLFSLKELLVRDINFAEFVLFFYILLISFKWCLFPKKISQEYISVSNNWDPVSGLIFDGSKLIAMVISRQQSLIDISNGAIMK